MLSRSSILHLLNVRQFELLSITKYLMKNRQSKTTYRSKQQTFQGLDNVYESYSFCIFVLDSAKLLAAEICS